MYIKKIVTAHVQIKMPVVHHSLWLVTGNQTTPNSEMINVLLFVVYGCFQEPLHV